jgi:hypothetical protein
VRISALLILALCACQHAPVPYGARGKSGSYAVAALPSGKLMPTGWTGREAPRTDQDADYYFVRDSDGAWLLVTELESNTADDATPAIEVLRRGLGVVAMMGFRVSKERPPHDLNMETTESLQPLAGTAAEAAEMAMTTERPPVRVYAAVVKHERHFIFVVAGASRRSELGIEEARSFARRIRFEAR